MPNKPYGTLSWTSKDYSRETGVATIKMSEYNALTYADLLADIGTLRRAIFGDSVIDTGICYLQSLTKETQTLFIDDNAPTPPSEEEFLRGRKWSIRYFDNVTLQKYSLSVPCARVIGLLLGNSDRADLSQPAWQAFKTAFEVVVKSRYANDVTMTRAYLVGRRL
jgi:hypothetical protein